MASSTYQAKTGAKLMDAAIDTVIASIQMTVPGSRARSRRRKS